MSVGAFVSGVRAVIEMRGKVGEGVRDGIFAAWWHLGWALVPVVVMFIRNGDDDGRENFEFAGLRRMEWRAFRWEATGVPSLSGGGCDWGGKHSATMRRLFVRWQICVFRAWCADNRME